MDGSAAIEWNRQALKRIVAMLVAMAQAAECTEARVPTLPRHLWLAILRLLRPAEAAARRLIIAATHGLAVTRPRPRKTRPKTKTMEPLLRRLGIAVVMQPADLALAAAAARPLARPRTLSLPLLDPLRRPLGAGLVGGPKAGGRRLVPPHAAPRIRFPGVAEPSPLPSPPSPDGPMSATRLNQRLAALAAALDDLPGQAVRFARCKARLEAGRLRRTSPLRSGRPPGGRLSRFDPSAPCSGKIREIDEILAHTHALAVYALERPDTS